MNTKCVRVFSRNPATSLFRWKPFSNPRTQRGLSSAWTKPLLTQKAVAGPPMPAYLALKGDVFLFLFFANWESFGEFIWPRCLWVVRNRSHSSVHRFPILLSGKLEHWKGAIGAIQRSRTGDLQGLWEPLWGWTLGRRQWTGRSGAQWHPLGVSNRNHCLSESEWQAYRGSSTTKGRSRSKPLGTAAWSGPHRGCGGFGLEVVGHHLTSKDPFLNL